MPINKFDTSRIELLPALILDHVCEHLPPHDLLAFAATSRTLRLAADAYAGLQLRRDETRSVTLREHRFRDDARRATLGERGACLRLLQAGKVDISCQTDTTGHLVPQLTWSRPTITRSRIDGDTTVVAAGNQLFCRISGSSDRWHDKTFGKPGVDDITDIKLLDGDVLVSQVNGQVSRWRLPTQLFGSYKLVRQLIGPQTEAVESIDHLTSSDLTSSITKSGILTLSRRGASQTAIETRARPWTMRFRSDGSSLAVGARCKDALTVYDVTETGLRLTAAYSAGKEQRTSVFSIYQPAHGELIFSGWYDGAVRLHDRRSPSKSPVLRFLTPYSDSAIYSLARSANLLYAGKATNGIVRIFDLRAADKHLELDCKHGDSVFLGGRKERGPVYDLHADQTGVVGAFDRGLQRLYFGASPGRSNAAADAYFFDHCCSK